MRGAADSRNLHHQTVSNAQHPPSPFSNSLSKPCVEAAATRRRVLLVDGGRGRTAPLPPGSRQPSQEATFSILRNLPDLPQHALFHELRWRWCSDLIIMQLNANSLAWDCSHPQTIYLCPPLLLLYEYPPTCKSHIMLFQHNFWSVLFGAVILLFIWRPPCFGRI